MALLSVENLQVNYGLINAIKGVSFEVNEGEIVSLIGANGAGKTSIMQSICNIIPKAGGNVWFGDRNVTNLPAHQLVPIGIAQVPERRRIFKELTVADNLRMGAFTRKDKNEIKQTLEAVYERFPILKQRLRQEAGTLSGGEQQMLAMGRALMSHPRLLLLDEPSMGLSPLYVNIIFDIIKQLNNEGTTILLVEQNAKKALSIANRAYVLEVGNIVKTGSGKDLLEDPEIRRAYLGD